MPILNTNKSIQATVTNGSGTSRLDSGILQSLSEETVSAVNRAIAALANLTTSVEPNANSLVTRDKSGEIHTATPTTPTSAVSKEYLESYVAEMLQKMTGGHCCGCCGGGDGYSKIRFQGEGSCVVDIRGADDETETLVVTFGEPENTLTRIEPIAKEVAELPDVESAENNFIYFVKSGRYATNGNVAITLCDSIQYDNDLEGEPERLTIKNDYAAIKAKDFDFYVNGTLSKTAQEIIDKVKPDDGAKAQNLFIVKATFFGAKEDFSGTITGSETKPIKRKPADVAAEVDELYFENDSNDVYMILCGTCKAYTIRYKLSESDDEHELKIYNSATLSEKIDEVIDKELKTSYSAYILLEHLDGSKSFENIAGTGATTELAPADEELIREFVTKTVTEEVEGLDVGIKEIVPEDGVSVTEDADGKIKVGLNITQEYLTNLFNSAPEAFIFNGGDSQDFTN